MHITLSYVLTYLAYAVQPCNQPATNKYQSTGYLTPNQKPICTKVCPTL